MPVNCDINHKNFPCRQLTGHGRLGKQNFCPRTDSRTKNKIHQKFFGHSTHNLRSGNKQKLSKEGFMERGGALLMRCQQLQLWAKASNIPAQPKMVAKFIFGNCKMTCKMFEFKNLPNSETCSFLVAALAVLHQCPVQFVQPKSILFQCMSIMMYADTHIPWLPN